VLKSDINHVGNNIVSIVVVTDPFGEYDEALLRDCFGDLMIPFKSHYVSDLSCPLDSFISEHHARNAALGQKQVIVELCEDPSSHVDDWVRLYSVLCRRHQIGGMRAFSRNCFAKQLETPGMVCFRALRHQQTVGMILWYLQKGVAYYHLGAYTEQGYQLRASFALFRRALDYFAGSGLKYANLGAGAGLGAAADDGLSRFKRGWTNVRRTAYLCGCICDRQEYSRLVRSRGIGTTHYFPAYREGEFN
jgi:hypothetical protein